MQPKIIEETKCIGGLSETTWGKKQQHQQDRVYKGDIALALPSSAGTHGYANAHVCTEYRIRKLTEKECFRLMGFKDSDFEKARAVNSATQIYKQAGNSIVKQVLMAIFLQMNIQGLKPWNDRNEYEIREMIK